MLTGLSLAWSWSPGGLLCFVVLALLYLLRLRQVFRMHQEDPQAPTVSKIRIASFVIGLLLFAVLFFSPVHTIGRTQLFLVHMAEVVVLTTFCAPLLLGGCSAVILRPVLEIPVVSTVIRFLTNPIVASVVFNAIFLLWHAPKIYNAATPNVALYNTMMLSIFLASLLNWWPIIGSLSELKKHGYPLQMLYVILDGQPLDIFAFILVYSGVALYHYHIPAQTGINAFGDQAAAGALLLLPGLVDLVVLSPLFISWMGQIEQKTRAADQRRLEEAMEYDEDEDNVEIETI
ncbi:cytochrome c oxidase assembly protein [Dictyobacter formicarum]|uniref:Cytochrome c oxidase assembly factor CtaG n=1 Tax=Dictyobacter formicarum TaxID=2778368 RepID=A0ABQ3VFG2_9CHLR|nr:cytochrome c oxidase assembly protein [Dictyobacter formicarum]GHO84469.1 hypothetical protein KSZ_24750 [Dictyobacter formicarum]